MTISRRLPVLPHQKAPAGWQGGLDDPFLNDKNWEFHLEMARKLGDRGWLALAWPGEYGGLHASPTAQMLFNEIAGYYKAPGVDMVDGGSGICRLRRDSCSSCRVTEISV